ncbi:hypothetical protein [Anaerocolumna chitinilytica]|uniref:hypothetical protein n=1 Tax=Anaerocolumna chitinilytica TaxID=1727145 RepID=UPI001CEC91F5|nr:hypothetical protein [Anaerocolumna chitinilytica]
MGEVNYQIELPSFTGRMFRLLKYKSHRKRCPIYKSRIAKRDSQIWICIQDGEFLRIQLLLPWQEGIGRNWIFQRSIKGSVATKKEGSGFIGIPIKKS